MSDLSNVRVFVTGAAGFIGANLVRVLIGRGAQVHVLVRPGANLWRLVPLTASLELHTGDLNDLDDVAKAVERARPQIVFHLAATGGHPKSREGRRTMLETTVLGTHNLLEATSTVDYYGFVHVCSSTVYGQWDQPLHESQQWQPITFRGAAKGGAALLCQQHARAHDRPLVLIRPFSVYGTWEGADRFVPTAILAALQGGEVPLTAPGFRHDWVYVSDVVEACLLAVQADLPPGETINVGSGEQWTNEDVVELIQEIAGNRIEVRAGAYPARPIDTAHWVADVGKAEELLGWQPRHSLRSGLEKSVAWFERHRDVYERV